MKRRTSIIKPVLRAALFVVLLGGCARSKLETQLTATATRGEYILQNIQMVANNSGLGWPRYGHIETNMVFKTSTDYFRKHITVHPCFFSAPGLDKCTDADSFQGAQNAWCLLENAQDADGATPVLFTRNLRVNSLEGLRGPLRDHLSDTPPFGKKGFVYVTRDGSSHALFEDDLYQDVSDILKLRGTLQHRILRP